jgi:hypothetical protein
VFILKVVKVVCFVIVLQVFILKVLAGSEETARSALPQRHRGTERKEAVLEDSEEIARCGLSPRHGGTEREEAEGFLGEKGNAIPVFSYEWQGKDLQEQECVRVANTGLRNRPFCGRA